MQIEENNVKSENDLKKEYLRGYRTHVRRISRIESELAELRSIRSSISMNNDGMPHGSGKSDLSSYAAELDELERNLKEERYNRYKDFKEIARRIKRIKSENEKDVLFYRYIKGMDWWEIAEKMKFSERQIYRFHGKALAHLKLPEKVEDVSECQ